MKQLSGDVLKKIEDKNIKPRAKSLFLLKHGLAWFGSIISLVLAVLASSVTIYMFVHTEWEMIQRIKDPFIYALVDNIPYLWVGFIVLFAALFLYNFKNTKNGYRYRMITLILGGVLISGLLGFMLFSFGLGERIDMVFAERVPYYERMMGPRAEYWHSPEEGRITGMIMEDHGDGTYLVDDGKTEWTVIMPEGAPPVTFNRPTHFIGEADGDTFRAEFAEPTPGMMIKPGGKMHENAKHFYIINRMMENERNSKPMRIF